jgi:hypothetical protein
MPFHSYHRVYFIPATNSWLVCNGIFWLSRDVSSNHVLDGTPYVSHPVILETADQMRLFWGEGSIHTTPALEALCSSSDPVSREARWLMPFYRFSNMCYIYSTCLDFLLWLRANCIGPNIYFDGHYHIDTVLTSL